MGADEPSADDLTELLPYLTGVDRKHESYTTAFEAGLADETIRKNGDDFVGPCPRCNHDTVFRFKAGGTRYMPTYDDTLNDEVFRLEVPRRRTPRRIPVKVPDHYYCDCEQDHPGGEAGTGCGLELRAAER